MKRVAFIIATFISEAGMFFCAPADNKVMKSITAIHIIFILFFYKIGREKKQKIITILPPSYIEMFIIY